MTATSPPSPPSLPSPPRRTSHVLVRVHDLHRAVQDFRAAGFDVAYATAPERKALHAHVWFPQGPVIELLTTPPGARWMRLPVDLRFGRGAGDRMVRWARQDEGFCDLALLVEHAELAGVTRRLADDGVPCGRAVHWTRRRPDGGETRFAFSYPRAGRLPFLVTPYDPPQHPSGVRHPNGARALTRIVLGVHPDDLRAVRHLAGDAPDLLLEEAPVTAVRAVHLAGLTRPPDPALLHGAVLRPADDLPAPPTTHGKGTSTS
ncbi:VOC family protein [Streptomyces albus]|uniref:VOC family protein n=1 Tax=Streptomyces albus TaxID=1888 RepID=UPI0024ADC4B0|nr:VOC family protein [Streptomyces albus]MDI6412616.1 VOC family protein [Streptomyces albus]